MKEFLACLTIAAGISSTAFGNVMIDDFDSLDKWGLGGSNGSISSYSLDTTTMQQGTAAAVVTAHHTTATSNDYVDFYRDNFGTDGINLSDLDTGKISFWFKNTYDAAHPIDLRIYSANGGHIEAGIASEYRDGTWHLIELTKDKFAAFGNFDASSVTVVQFRSYGDASNQEYNNVFAVDDLKLVSAPIPEPASLSVLGVVFAGAVLSRRRFN